MFRGALDVFEEILGAEHPTSVICKTSVATALMELHRLEEARRLLCEALEASERTVGRRHFNTAVCLVRIADLNYRCGEFDLSAHHATEALSILEETVGRTHFCSALAIFLLACTAVAKGDCREARRFHDEALASLLSKEQSHSWLARRLVHLKARIDSDLDSPSSTER